MIPEPRLYGSASISLLPRQLCEVPWKRHTVVNHRTDLSYGPAIDRGGPGQDRLCGTYASPDDEFLVNDAMQRPIKIRRILARKHQVQVLTIDPIPFCAQLGFHALVKWRARQRVRNRYSDFIGTAAFDHAQR